MSSLKSFKLGLDSILRPLAGHQADISHLSPTRLIPLLAERLLLEYEDTCVTNTSISLFEIIC